uniref:Nucleophosmin n=1 Tax=Denticeps clupeoides TaxID=299321 RepID=A0AAY4A431_9TELE
SLEIFLGCELKSRKEVVFNPEEDGFEHMLSLRMVCVDHSTNDEMHVIEVQAVIASLKPSTLPSVCLGGFEITPPVVFRLKSGSGPVADDYEENVYEVAEDYEEEVAEDYEEEVADDYEENVYEVAEDYEENDYEEEVAEDYEENDYEEEVAEDYEEEEEESHVKPKKAPSKPQTPAQNGKTPKDSKKPQTPLTLPEIKAKMMATVKKGVTLPKLLPKFENYMKNAFKVTDTKVRMWKWRQTVEEKK